MLHLFVRKLYINYHTAAGIMSHTVNSFVYIVKYFVILAQLLIGVYRQFDNTVVVVMT